MIDISQQILNAVQDGIRDGVKQKIGGYGSPLDKMLNEVLAQHDAALRKLLAESIQSAVDDAQFQEEIRGGVRHKLAQLLVQRFGGELEKQVNALKSDPATRARITLAIEEIVKSKAA